MVPRGEGSDASVEAMVAQVEKHPISSILIIIGNKPIFLFLSLYFNLCYFY